MPQFSVSVLFILRWLQQRYRELATVNTSKNWKVLKGVVLIREISGETGGTDLKRMISDVALMLLNSMLPVCNTKSMIFKAVFIYSPPHPQRTLFNWF